MVSLGCHLKSSGGLTRIPDASPLRDLVSLAPLVPKHCLASRVGINTSVPHRWAWTPRKGLCIV